MLGKVQAARADEAQSTLNATCMLEKQPEFLVRTEGVAARRTQGISATDMKRFARPRDQTSTCTIVRVRRT